MTLSEVQEVAGNPGDFTVKILRKPRFIDVSKCTGCGECALVCPVERKNEYDMGLNERRAVYRRYAQAVPGAFSIEKRGVSPCKATCPAHISVQGYVALAARGKYREALQLIKQENPLPAICGRVCHHPCESACKRGELDSPVAIDSIKRFLADLDLEAQTRYVPEIKQRRDEKVAIIGSGPAGLSCAYYLAEAGYRVTVFERLPVLGGMLTVGIPAYRLPKDTIEAEIQVMREMGVEFKTGVEIGRDLTVSQLREQGFKAFFIGIGAHECKALGIPGEQLEGVVPGVDYLRDVNLGRQVPLGDRVAVIGGGNVAMDAVRTALRNGSKAPFIIYRRSLAEMPANEEEIDECREEGIEIITLANPRRIIGENGRVKAVECVRMELGEPDASGRRRPVAIKGSEFIMEVDAVIAAIGQESDWACLTEECACRLSDWGTMTVDPLTFQTHDSDIFAGGDAVSGPKTVIEAIAAGKQAAISIGRFITGEDLAEGRQKEWNAVAEVPMEGIVLKSRAKMAVLSPETRTSNFKEVQLGFTEEQVLEEAARCLACGVCSECMQCVEACVAKAPVHDDKPEEMTVNVGAIIAASGFDPFDPSAMDNYGYGKFPNVISSMELERILSASGPTQGHLLRPSDQTEPKKIAWLQCVGSRDIRKGANKYCSGVCCTYAIKEAMIAKEHSKDGLDTAVFYMDMRTFGKDYEKYFNRAKQQGVRFIRARVHTIDPAGDGNLSISYADENGNMSVEQFDMVVLSVGLEVGERSMELARRLGIELNDSRFVKTAPFTPVNTSREGVFACGAFQGPKDIPQSVMEASAAACAASGLLTQTRWSVAKIKEKPVESKMSMEPPRIGVFVCRCGTNIAGTINTSELRDYARSLPGVVYVEENLFTCSQDTQVTLARVIREQGINRVVVAACTPRTHEPLFQETLMNAGLNKYLFEMANIRNQDSWCHSDNKPSATRKAKDLVRMAVARVSLLAPLVETPLNIVQTGLVIGGGVAGLSAALGLARQGFQVAVIEKESEPGGLCRGIGHTIEGNNVAEFVDELIKEVRADNRITLFTQARLAEFSGYKGNFLSRIDSASGQTVQIGHGVTIVATGGREYTPKEFGYGLSSKVMTQLQLDELIRKEPANVSGWKRAVMVQCVGSRNEQNPNCSRVCCQSAVKHALELKKMNPEMQVVILYRDMRTYGLLEDYYTEARRQGIVFARYDRDKEPLVSVDGQSLSVEFNDHVLNRPVRVEADALILSAAALPANNDQLAGMLKLPRNPEGFFTEAHAKLRPVEFAAEGIFMCGLAHAPKLITETIAQALAVASRAGTFLASTSQTIGGVVAHVDADLCASCQVCVRCCPFGVPKIEENYASRINEALCQGCGVCVSECPAKAIVLGNYSDNQVMAQLDALLEGVI